MLHFGGRSLWINRRNAGTAEPPNANGQIVTEAGGRGKRCLKEDHHTTRSAIGHPGNRHPHLGQFPFHGLANRTTL